MDERARDLVRIVLGDEPIDCRLVKRRQLSSVGVKPREQFCDLAQLGPARVRRAHRQRSGFRALSKFPQDLPLEVPGHDRRLFSREVDEEVSGVNLEVAESDIDRWQCSSTHQHPSEIADASGLRQVVQRFVADRQLSRCHRLERGPDRVSAQPTRH
ncbi:hypothetical protein [Agromyces bauzanensis]|uniref:hypothetical protein n=1 Tax=Agromyces bauzanensis TaxID=1308924 RepID=UPI00166E2582|nr:hypothetical protein [Agromyces bauzanensis]